MTKYIHVDSNNSRKTVYHTDENCTRLKPGYRPVTESEIEYHNLRLCEWCDPEITHPGANTDQDHGFQEALKEAAKNNE